MTTQSRSKPTITDKLVTQAMRRVAKRLETAYEESCPHKPAGNEWFARLDRAEAKLHELLAKRPITKAEIATIADRAFKALRQGLREEGARQPRMQECVNIETGETRMIPRSD